LLAESKHHIANGQTALALKLLSLMRSEPALKLIKSEIWAKEQVFEIKFGAALVLAAMGDLDVQDFLHDTVRTQNTQGDATEVYIRSTLALVKLGDSTDCSRLKRLLEERVVPEEDSYLYYLLQGYGREITDFNTRILRWIEYCWGSRTGQVQ
jgi:hypothetical protein